MFKAKQIMQPDLASIDPYCTVAHAISLMVEGGTSCLPVTDSSGRVLGTITDVQLAGLTCDSAAERHQVSRYMSTEPTTVEEDASWVDVADAFRSGPGQIPVTRDGKLVGRITLQDFLRAIHQVRRQTAALRFDSAHCLGMGVRQAECPEVRPVAVHRESPAPPGPLGRTCFAEGQEPERSLT